MSNSDKTKPLPNTKTGLPCGTAVEGCSFDWNEYKKTLDRFDTNLHKAEERLQRQLDNHNDRLQKVEAANLQYLPEQGKVLNDLKDGQDSIRELLGGLKTRITDHDKRILDLEKKANTDSSAIIKARNDQWVERFKLILGSALLVGWAVGEQFARFQATDKLPPTPMWVTGLIIAVVSFIFGESAVKKVFTAIRST